MAKSYVAVPELTYRWGISRQAIHQQIALGRITGARKSGNVVLVPITEVRRIEDRMRTKLLNEVERLEGLLDILDDEPAVVNE